MPTYKITSDTQTKGRVTRKIMALTYADALAIMDEYVDTLDGNFEPFDPDNLPETLTFDELVSGDYGEFVNYYEVAGGRWKILLRNGWFYTGERSSEIARRCGPLARIDPHTITM